jgi:hypothetical protein
MIAPRIQQLCIIVLVPLAETRCEYASIALGILAQSEPRTNLKFRDGPKWPPARKSLRRNPRAG